MVRWQSGESLHSPSGQEGVAQAQPRRRRAHSTGRRNSGEKRLGPDDRAIPSPRRPPGIIEIRRTSGDREFRRELLVNLDAQTRLLLGQHVAVLDFGAAHKYLLRLFWETAAFMDPELETHQPERQRRAGPQRRPVTWPGPAVTPPENT